MTNAHNNNNTI